MTKTVRERTPYGVAAAQADQCVVERVLADTVERDVGLGPVFWNS
jgi:hypothetical protein